MPHKAKRLLGAPATEANFLPLTVRQPHSQPPLGCINYGSHSLIPLPHKLSFLLFVPPTPTSDMSNIAIRQPGPATIKGNIVLGRPKPGTRPHTTIFCAEMFVGAATSPQVCGLLVWYSGEGVTYPEAGYYNIESTVSVLDVVLIRVEPHPPVVSSSSSTSRT